MMNLRSHSHIFPIRRFAKQGSALTLALLATAIILFLAAMTFSGLRRAQLGAKGGLSQVRSQNRQETAMENAARVLLNFLGPTAIKSWYDSANSDGSPKYFPAGDYEAAMALFQGGQLGDANGLAQGDLIDVLFAYNTQKTTNFFDGTAAGAFQWEKVPGTTPSEDAIYYGYQNTQNPTQPFAAGLIITPKTLTQDPEDGTLKITYAYALSAVASGETGPNSKVPPPPSVGKLRSALSLGGATFPSVSVTPFSTAHYSKNRVCYDDESLTQKYREIDGHPAATGEFDVYVFPASVAYEEATSGADTVTNSTGSYKTMYPPASVTPPGNAKGPVIKTHPGLGQASLVTDQGVELYNLGTGQVQLLGEGKTVNQGYEFLRPGTTIEATEYCPYGSQNRLCVWTREDLTTYASLKVQAFDIEPSSPSYRSNTFIQLGVGSLDHQVGLADQGPFKASYLNGTTAIATTRYALITNIEQIGINRTSGNQGISVVLDSVTTQFDSGTYPALPQTTYPPVIVSADRNTQASTTTSQFFIVRNDPNSAQTQAQLTVVKSVILTQGGNSSSMTRADGTLPGFGYVAVEATQDGTLLALRNDGKLLHLKATPNFNNGSLTVQTLGQVNAPTDGATTFSMDYFPGTRNLGIQSLQSGGYLMWNFFSFDNTSIASGVSAPYTVQSQIFPQGYITTADKNKAKFMQDGSMYIPCLHNTKSRWCRSETPTDVNGGITNTYGCGETVYDQNGNLIDLCPSGGGGTLRSCDILLSGL